MRRIAYKKSCDVVNTIIKGVFEYVKFNLSLKC